jgi:hypothetical protein
VNIVTTKMARNRTAKHTKRMPIQQCPTQAHTRRSDHLFRYINGLEAFYSHLDSVYERQVIEFHPTPAEAREALAYVGDIQWFMYEVYAAKYRELVGGGTSYSIY